ncbi:hypothetical protein [Jingyaoa shaoxingensis]|uniref:Uncharacterized protein n=1 Tax=Jingyaoa shaoxingensis TaxID=2763671 RepID=A0ABR7N6U9_9FIRM|nr:hypothetical protein [Jingyaoa shaoxingensis]MBC8571870.1 hypothetical protein [Jingyaoa shaoxingensis]
MKVFKKLSMCILSGLLCLGIGATTQAATKTGTNVYEMNTWAGSSVTKDRLTSVDITGNGKKDKIETETTRVEIELKVNGKIVGMYLTGETNIQVVKLSKKSFFEITTYEKGNKINCGLYEMKKNKLTRVLDYKKLVNLKQYVKNNFITSNGCWGGFQATKAKGNTIYLRGWFGTKNLGQVNAFNMPLSYSGKNFTLKSTAATADAGMIPPSKNESFTRSFTAAQKIQTYKAAGSSKKSFTIKKNAKFSVKKLAVVKKNLYVQVKSGRKTGWIRLNTSSKKMVKAAAISIAG